MKVIVVTSTLPFDRGGAEYLVDSLCEALAAFGHEVERFDLPFSSDYRTMMPEMLAFRMLDLTGFGDRLIAVRTPSYLVKHHRKTVWFIHHHRAAFDLWGTPYQDMPNGPVGSGFREAFRSADNTGLHEAAAVFANSARVRQRLAEYNAIDAEVLYPPLGMGHGLSPASYSGYILCPGRLVDHKRQHLCLEAMQHVRTPVRLTVAGPPGSGEYLDKLNGLIAGLRLKSRVTLLPRWIPEEEKAGLFANAQAVAYVPYDEDSYGYVSLEAAHCRKAVLTCSDSGGLLEFVEHGKSGFVSEPDPAALAACFDAVWERDTAAAMGEAAHARLAALNIAWEPVIARLLG